MFGTALRSDPAWSRCCPESAPPPEVTPSRAAVEDVAGMLPGAGLAQLLSRLDPSALDDESLVDIALAWDRQGSHSQARQVAGLARLRRPRAGETPAPRWGHRAGR